jgi:hypothetical protein
MAARLHELVWVAVLLDSCPNVEALSIRVEGDWLTTGPCESVPVIGVHVHAGGQADAAALARALRLGAVEGRCTDSEYGTSEWRTWRGWVADGSREAAVSVEVTGADLLPAWGDFDDSLDEAPEWAVA